MCKPQKKRSYTCVKLKKHKTTRVKKTKLGLHMCSHVEPCVSIILKNTFKKRFEAINLESFAFVCWKCVYISSNMTMDEKKSVPVVRWTKSRAKAEPFFTSARQARWHHMAAGRFIRSKHFWPQRFQISPSSEFPAHILCWSRQTRLHFPMLEVRKWFVTTAKIPELETCQKKSFCHWSFTKFVSSMQNTWRKKNRKNYVFDGLENTWFYLYYL